MWDLSYFVLLITVLVAPSLQIQTKYGITDVEDKVVVSARVVSCIGWRLNKLPQVKKFVNMDVPFYVDVTFKSIPGRNPDLQLLNEAGDVVQLVDLTKFDRDGANTLMTELGFYKKQSSKEETPENLGPYKHHEEL